MIELAVFGSLMLLCLSFFVRYGLTYNYQQMTQQEAFRIGLQRAHDNWEQMQSSVTLLRDRRMVNPSSPFVTGPRQLFVGSAGITTGNTGSVLSPTTDEELPVQQIALNDGQNPLRFRLADYRLLQNVEKRLACNYVDFYGKSAVDMRVPGTEISLDYTCKTRFNPPQVKNDPDKYGLYVDLRILDACYGDIVEQGGCRQECLDLIERNLRVPSYCPIPNCESDPGKFVCDDTYKVSVDFDHLRHERTTVLNQRTISEDASQHASSTDLHEQDTYHRNVNLSHISLPHDDALHPNYDTNGNDVAETEQTIDAQRHESFQTPW